MSSPFVAMASVPSPPAPPSLPAGPAAPLTGSENTPKKTGKNLAWSQVELLALAETAPTILQDAAVGNGQTAAKLGTRLRARFIERAPLGSGTEIGTGGELDALRWKGRTGRARKNRWDLVKAACIVYEQAVKFVAAGRVTGNPKPEELHRCHPACYNAHQDGSGMGARSTHLTAIAMDKHYPVREPFEYIHCWEHLSESTSLSQTDAVIVDRVAEVVGPEGVGGKGQAPAPPAVAPSVVSAAAVSRQRQERPQGFKAAKMEKARKRKLDGTDDGENKDAVAIMARMDKIADSLGKESKRQQDRHEDHLRVQADKLALSAFSALYGGAAVALPEGLTALSELRQQY